MFSCCLQREAVWYLSCVYVESFAAALSHFDVINSLLYSFFNVWNVKDLLKQENKQFFNTSNMSLTQKVKEPLKNKTLG
jgi:hypothetical protein